MPNAHSDEHSRPAVWLTRGLLAIAALAVVTGLVRWKHVRRHHAVETTQEVAGVRVQVLNACGEPGLAQKVRDHLMKFQVDVRETGNAGYLLPETVLLDRNGDHRWADKLAHVVGLPADHVVQQLNRTLVDIDVTMVIGKDYRRFFTALPQE
jgi:hypothetical protein